MFPMKTPPNDSSMSAPSTFSLHPSPSPNGSAESQRDSVIQPRVARNELPWGKRDNEYNPERVAARCNQGQFMKLANGARTPRPREPIQPEHADEASALLPF